MNQNIEQTIEELRRRSKINSLSLWDRELCAKAATIIEQLSAPKEEVVSAISFYDQVETYPNCTVEVLTNTHTGDVSVGWWKNDPDEEEDEAC